MQGHHAAHQVAQLAACAAREGQLVELLLDVARQCPAHAADVAQVARAQQALPPAHHALADNGVINSRN